MLGKMLTHLHMVVYTWWCWHFCKGEVREVLEEIELKKRRDGSWIGILF
jgi:hypothetical protein